MKRLTFAIVGLLSVIALVAVGCGAGGILVTVHDEVPAVSSCVSCHSDKELLQETAAPVEEEEEPEESSGEG